MCRDEAIIYGEGGRLGMSVAAARTDTGDVMRE